MTARPIVFWAAIKDEARMWHDLRAIRLSRNFGKELALCAGLERAGGNAVIVMDGDGQHPPSLLALMIERVENFRSRHYRSG